MTASANLYLTHPVLILWSEYPLVTQAWVIGSKFHVTTAMPFAISATRKKSLTGKETEQLKYSDFLVSTLPRMVTPLHCIELDDRDVNLRLINSKKK